MNDKLIEVNIFGLKFIRKVLQDNREDNYYRKKVISGTMMSPDEMGIIEYILNNFEKSTTICEPGTGFAQLPLVLGAFGYSCSGVEIRDDRVGGAKMLKKMFSKKYKESESVRIIKGRYPEDIPDSDILLTFNFVSTFNKDNKEDIIRSFHKFKHVIIDSRTFGIRRDEMEDRDRLIEEIKSFGFEAKKAFGSFYVITSTKDD